MIETRLGLAERAVRTQARRESARERIALVDRLGAEIARHPKDPRIPWRMGRTAQESGSFLPASRCFEAALALDANFQPARDSLPALRAAHAELARVAGRPISFPALTDRSSPSSLP
jgi:hypothetical protein